MPAALRTLRARVAAASTVVLIVVLALASILIVTLVERQLRNDLADQNQATLTRIQSEIESGVDPGRIKLPLASDGTEFNISTPDGEYVNSTVVVFETLDGIPLTDLDEFDDVSFEELFSTEEIDVIFEDLSLWDITAVTATAPGGDSYEIQAFSRVSVVDRSVGQVRAVLWIVIPLLAAVFAAVAWFTVGRALRPVDEITSQAAAIGLDTLDQRVDEPGTNDEIDRLAGTLNSMFDRLEQGALRQEQFVSDASHELQTPLTVMLGEAELAAGSHDTNSIVQANQRVIEQGQKMSLLIQDLLNLARTGESGLHRVDVDVDDVLRESARLQPGPVDTSQVGPARTIGDLDSLTRLFRNLLDNASRYGNGQIAVSCAIDPTGAEIIVHVDDDGPGIPLTQREQIFERFVRLDESRARTTGGSGLGLAITKAIVEAHNGALGVGDSPLGGARFEVRLPLSRPQQKV